MGTSRRLWRPSWQTGQPVADPASSAFYRSIRRQTAHAARSIMKRDNGLGSPAFCHVERCRKAEINISCPQAQCPKCSPSYVAGALSTGQHRGVDGRVSGEVVFWTHNGYVGWTWDPESPESGRGCFMGYLVLSPGGGTSHSPPSAFPSAGRRACRSTPSTGTYRHTARYRAQCCH